ncbi:hypothetical protein SAMN04488028_101353 [Reichenbachiella agariperforans]|uniref:Uncharacterized protein n=2 Tax=Reichenbachiellaceae TaxID=2762302 RepID=A0A1M6JX11_REIAG|nr:hypothetical protein SAMN04488028_101353 [Reichenbachiella agariperforans]
MKNFRIVLFFIGALTFSCSDSDDNTVSLEDDAPDTCANTEVYDPNFTGTACCIQRNSDLSIGEIIEYEYFTNLTDPSIDWEVISGDIEIVSGSSSSVVTIRLGDSFTEGVINAQGISSENAALACGESVTIMRN